MSKALSLKTTFVAVVAAALVALFALTAGAGTAWADGNTLNVSTIKATSTQRMVYYANNPDGNYWWLCGNSQNAKFTNIKSSNKGVVAFKSYKTSVELTLKKAGKAKVTFKYGSKKYTMNFVVAKYTNPVTTFKVGATNYAKYFKKVPWCESGKSLAGKKLTVKASSAWKLDHFEYEDSSWNIKKAKTLKKFPKGSYMVIAVMKHKSTGALQNLLLMGN